jgi:protein-tyrosine kinase
VAANNLVSAATESSVPAHADRLIGSILVDAGRLAPESAARVLRLQREENLRFGDAATRLGLLTQADIDFALSRQFNHTYLRRGESKVSHALVAAYAPFSHESEALRAVRSQLMARWFDGNPGHRALAIVSAGRKDGRSFLAANLAVVFSQLGANTLLIDADLRNPCQHVLFGLDNRAGLSAVLSARAGPDAIQRIPGLLELSVLPAGAQPPNPHELLARAPFWKLLRDVEKKFDVVLLDCPAAAHYADAQTVAVRAGAALIVVRKNATRRWQVRGVADTLSQASATIIGAVVSDF